MESSKCTRLTPGTVTPASAVGAPFVFAFRPKATSDLEPELRALQEFEDREKELLNENVPEEESVRPKKRYFRPLPEAEYRSSRVAIEKEISSAEPKDLPKKFMTESTTEAVVSKAATLVRSSPEEQWSSG